MGGKTKVDPKKRRCEDMNWIYLAYSMVHCQVIVKMIMNL